MFSLKQVDASPVIKRDYNFQVPRELNCDTNLHLSTPGIKVEKFPEFEPTSDEGEEVMILLAVLISRR